MQPSLASMTLGKLKLQIMEKISFIIMVETVAFAFACWIFIGADRSILLSMNGFIEIGNTI